MSTKTEVTALSLVEKELEEFQSKKTQAEGSLKDELAKAKTEYDSLVKDINAKYNVDELTEKIKRHYHFVRLLKGEIPIPDDINTKKVTNNKNTIRVSDWYGKINAALSKLEKTIDDEPKLKEIKTKLIDLYPELKQVKDSAFANAWVMFKKSFNEIK